VHPNAKGHAYVASIVIDFLEKRLADWRTGHRAKDAAFPVKPVFTTDYDRGGLVDPTDVKTVANKGFGPSDRKSDSRTPR